MASEITNLGLVNKCKRFILKDPTVEALDDLIQDALISAEREIRMVDQMGAPLAWLRDRYDELFTRPYAAISAITQANPGVITAASANSNIEGHGFENDDLVMINGSGGMKRLNNRIFRVYMEEKVTDGSFAATATHWTSGSGWTLNAAVTSDADLEAKVETATAGKKYKVIFTLTGVTVGSITPQYGGVDGDAVTVNGTHTQYITTTGTGVLKFQGTGFSGTVSYASITEADDLSLKQLNDQLTIDTSSYEEYNSGGTIYHVGIKLPHATIEPTSTLESTADYRWKIGRVFGVMFDLYPVEYFTEESQFNDARYWQSEGRPRHARYVRLNYSSPIQSGTEHFIMFPPVGQRYNIGVQFEKSYPDLATFTTAVYPPHPPETHDFIWHRALANLSGNAEKMRRTTKDGGDNTKIEIMHAQIWTAKVLEEERKIIDLNRKMLGGSGNMGMRA